MHIRQATSRDAQAVTALALLLWPDHDMADLATEMAGFITGRESAVFLAEADGSPVAFAQAALRHDYVEGADTSPVGYLEGIYVLDSYRRAGIADMLLRTAEAWARTRGCTQFASDCELDNTQSIAFHMGVGFAEAGRLVCFIKDID